EAHTVELATVPAWVDADEVRFDQIVNNLLGNAVKYTPAGGRIDVSVAPEEGSVVIRVRDTGLDRGSTFRVRLPARSAPAQDAPAAPVAVPSVPRRVLVIEDNNDARDMVAYMLKDAGHEVIEATDGPTGLATA